MSSSINPLVSIIVPMFNAELFVREALDSILNQTYRNIEIIVVDDGSTDNSRRIVISYGPKVKYLYQENSGTCSKPRNLGIKHSNGEFLTFFDADDIMLPHKIEAQVDFFEKHSDMQIVLTDYINFAENRDYDKSHFMDCHKLSHLLSTISRGDSLILERDIARDFLASENFTTSNSPLLRRILIEDIGMFDDGLMASEDIEFTYRVALKHNIGILNIIGFRRRLHLNNMSLNIEKMSREKIKSRKKMLMLENNNNTKNALKYFLANVHGELSEFYLGKDNETAKRELLQSLSYKFLPIMQFKTLLKLFLSQMGIYKRSHIISQH